MRDRCSSEDSCAPPEPPAGAFLRGEITHIIYKTEYYALIFGRNKWGSGGRAIAPVREAGGGGDKKTASEAQIRLKIARKPRRTPGGKSRRCGRQKRDFHRPSRFQAHQSGQALLTPPNLVRPSQSIHETTTRIDPQKTAIDQLFNRKRYVHARLRPILQPISPFFSTNFLIGKVRFCPHCAFFVNTDQIFHNDPHIFVSN